MVISNYLAPPNLTPDSTLPHVAGGGALGAPPLYHGAPLHGALLPQQGDLQQAGRAPHHRQEVRHGAALSRQTELM